MHFGTTWLRLSPRESGVNIFPDFAHYDVSSLFVYGSGPNFEVTYLRLLVSSFLILMSWSLVTDINVDFESIMDAPVGIRNCYRFGSHC